jgi:hypothetical protein
MTKNVTFSNNRRTVTLICSNFPRENEAKHQGSKGDIAARIEADTQVKLEAMNRSVAASKEKVLPPFKF